LGAAVFACVAMIGASALAKNGEPVHKLPPQQKNFPFDQTWSLREINGKPAPAELDISLKIDSARRGSGFSGCNSWSATIYPIQDQHLLVGPFALTKRQCPKDIMTLEIAFLSALLDKPTWDLVNDDLVIKGPRGSLRMVRSL
jgi:heat shock protein HslJ